MTDDDIQHDDLDEDLGDERELVPDGPADDDGKPDEKRSVEIEL